MCRASTPLPVPVSPSKSTVASVMATRPAMVSASRSAALFVSKRGRTPRPVVPLRLGEIGAEARRLHRFAHGMEHLRRREGLGQVVGGAGPHGVDGVVDGGVGRHDHHRRGRRLLRQRARDRDAIHPAEAQIDQRQIRRRALGRGDGGLAAGCERHAVAGALEAEPQHLADALLVVDDEDPNLTLLAHFAHLSRLSAA